MQHKLVSRQSILLSLLALGGPAMGCGGVDTIYMSGEAGTAEEVQAREATLAREDEERAAYDGAHVDLATQMQIEANELGMHDGPVKTAFLPNVNGEMAVYHYQEVDGMAVSGDMVLGTLEELDEQEKGVYILNKLWKARTLVYEFDASASASTKSKFNKAKDSWISSTGLKLKERAGEADYVLVKEVAKGCSSPVGKRGGAQELKVSSDCSEGNIRHEIGHAFGFEHEQTRCKRGDDINVLFDNIVDSTESANFTERCGADFKTVESIDYGSVMMYSSFLSSDFAVDTKKPVMTKKDGTTWTSQRDALSPTDVKTIKTLYNKFENPRAVTTIPVRWFANETSPKTQFCKDNGYVGASSTEETTSLAAGKRYAEYNTQTGRWEAKSQANPVRVYTEINCKF